MFKRFSTYVLLLLTSTLTAGCGVTDWVSSNEMKPEDIIQSAQINMQQLESIRTEGTSVLEGNLLGSSFEYQMHTVSQSKLKKGSPVETYMETSMLGEGIPERTETIYFSDTQYGAYNPSTSSWDITDFTAEDQATVQLFLSSFDPSSSLNKYADSKIKQDLKIIGKEDVNGVSCIGISIETDADELIKDMTPALTAIAGESMNLAASIAGGMVKDINLEYWIGEADSLVYGMNMELTTPFGNYHSDVKVYDHNEPFELPK